MKRLMLAGAALLVLSAPAGQAAAQWRDGRDARETIEVADRGDRREDRADRREDKRDRREDRRDEREDRRDRREDRRDARRDGGPADRREDRWDRREDRYDRREDRWDRREDRRDAREDRREARREWRYSRSDRNWWNGHPRFRDYRGSRSGYWYAPGYGYVVYPRDHSRRHWRRGEYLPRYYHRYRVYDPYMYDARPAPPGYVWVHYDNDLVLISLTTGLILDVLFDLY